MVETATSRSARKRATTAPPKAGRDLPAAIAVGLLLGGGLLASLLIVKEAYIGLTAAACVIAIIELERSLRSGGLAIPLPPVLLGAALLPPVSYIYGAGPMASAYLVAVAAVLLWRGASGLNDALSETAGGIFALSYVPLLASFTTLMLAEPGGEYRVLLVILLSAASDTGGYIAGVLWGKHPMAPSASPKKSWEGFVGSVVGAALVGFVTCTFLLDTPIWVGPVLGAVAATVATLGDLVESILKRDLGVKDMGHLLPGHGGLMDRLDSILVVAPVVWFATQVLL